MGIEGTVVRCIHFYLQDHYQKGDLRPVFLTLWHLTAGIMKSFILCFLLFVISMKYLAHDQRRICRLPLHFKFIVPWDHAIGYLSLYSNLGFCLFIDHAMLWWLSLLNGCKLFYNLTKIRMDFYGLKQGFPTTGLWTGLLGTELRKGRVSARSFICTCTELGCVHATIPSSFPCSHHCRQLVDPKRLGTAGLKFTLQFELFFFASLLACG